MQEEKERELKRKQAEAAQKEREHLEASERDKKQKLEADRIAAERQQHEEQLEASKREEQQRLDAEAAERAAIAWRRKEAQEAEDLRKEAEKKAQPSDQKEVSEVVSALVALK